jgi:thiol-disulfide isomerase/thioredoxin
MVDATITEPSKRERARNVATTREQIESQPSGIVIDPRVLIAGGGVALVGLIVLAVFLWMVPNAAAREVNVACNELGWDREKSHSGVPPDPVCNGQPCTLPTPAPDFTAYDYQGKPVRLSDFRGKVVLVNFWASWCHVCKEEKPAIFEMAGDLTSDDFVVLAVASDRSWADVLVAMVDALAPNVPIPGGDITMKQALDLYAKGLPNGTPYKVLLDPPEGDGNIGRIAASWGIKAVPESVLIDRRGNIRRYIINKRDWNTPVAETCLRSMIDE